MWLNVFYKKKLSQRVKPGGHFQNNAKNYFSESFS